MFKKNTYLLYVPSIIVSFFSWWSYIHYLDIKIAWGGFSPIAWVYQYFKPENFVNDFPSGIENYNSSAFMYIYKFAYGYLNIRPEIFINFIIGFEIVVLALAFYYLIRTILPDSSPIVSFLVIVLVVASYARNMNIARFAQPFFIGQFYNVADALRIFAIAAILRDKPILSAVLLAGSFITHPTLGIIGMIFVITIIFLTPKRFVEKKFLTAGIIYISLVGFWIFITFSTKVISGNIPNQLWFELTKMFSFHWYPVEFGLFTTKHQLVFIPFLSFSLLLIFYFAKIKFLREIDKKIIAGMTAMTILILAGIIISILKPNPALIKLSLHRANDLIVSVGLIYVVNGLFAELTSKQLWQGSLAFLLLISPFVFSPGYPLLLSVLLVATKINITEINFRNKTTIILLIGIILTVVFYFFNHLLGLWTDNAYSGFKMLSYLPILFMIALYIFSRLFPKDWMQILIIISFFIGAIFWITNQKSDTKLLSLSQNYKQVQLWAKEQTQKDSLFMVDPSISYGWRDYSQRSSFGVLREWLHTSWIYNSDFKIYKEGIKRFNEFSLNLNDYLDEKPPLKGYQRLSKDVGNKYYSLGDDWRLNMADRYQIDYFVMIKSKIKRNSKLPVVFQNKYFLVLSIPKSN